MHVLPPGLLVFMAVQMDQDADQGVIQLCSAARWLAVRIAERQCLGKEDTIVC